MQQTQPNQQAQTVQTSGVLENMARGVKRNTGKLLAGALLFAAGMGVESKTNYLHETAEQAKMVKYAMEGYALEGDPFYRQAKVELHVDHENKLMYGVLVDEERGLSRKINDELVTRDSVPKEFYRLVKNDVEALWNGVNDMHSNIRESSKKEGLELWNKTKEAYENLSDAVDKKLR